MSKNSVSRRFIILAAVGASVGGLLAIYRWWWPAESGQTSGDAGAAAVVKTDADAGVVDGGGDADSAPAEKTFEPPPDEQPETLEEQREQLYRTMRGALGLDEKAVARVREIFEASRPLSQGNPKKTEHPMTRSECRAIRAEAKTVPGDPACGAPHMVRLGKSACIDQFEFPNIPCEYPVVLARAKEAAELCQAVGKRLCDAHEWEGACAGKLRSLEEEYAFGQRRMMMRYLHNKDRELIWAYGKEQDHSLCATGSKKTPKCGGGYKMCGSNTYPAGAFPKCVSSLGVYDQHGNAAEHMNLPLKPEQLTSRGGTGETEMKGSWFFFGTLSAHEDDCRWRALNWHGTTIVDVESHRNYHLGFRCCGDVK